MHKLRRSADRRFRASGSANPMQVPPPHPMGPACPLLSCRRSPPSVIRGGWIPVAAHIRRYLQEVRPKLKGKRDPGNLLLGREGKPLTRLTMKRMRTLLKGAGLSEGRLKELSPVHCLRHSCGVMLYRATKNLRLVQKQLRHSRSTTTEVYANLLDEDWRAGVEAAWTVTSARSWGGSSGSSLAERSPSTPLQATVEPSSDASLRSSRRSHGSPFLDVRPPPRAVECAHP